MYNLDVVKLTHFSDELCILVYTLLYDSVICTNTSCKTTTTIKTGDQQLHQSKTFLLAIL
jgi:hypothetical protein